jgi:hypothetical protein
MNNLVIGLLCFIAAELLAIFYSLFKIKKQMESAPKAPE